MMTILKQRARSKAYWLGILATLYGALEQAHASGLIGPLLPEAWRGFGVAAIGVLVLVVREFTHGKLSDKVKG